MKKIVRQRLANEKRQIEQRLKAAVVVNEGGPVLGGGNIEYELSARASGWRMVGWDWFSEWCAGSGWRKRSTPM